MSNGKFPGTPILHVDDEYNVLTSIKIRLSQKGIDNIVQCLDSRQVIPMLEKQDYSLVLLDLMMPYIKGEELLPQIAEKFPHIPVIMVTSIEGTPNVSACRKKGAYDYITKPIDDDRLVTIINHALERRKDQVEIDGYKESQSSDELKNPEIFKDIITTDLKIKKIFQNIEKWGAHLDQDFPIPVSILITGENGTGKELIAKAIHEISKVKGKVKGELFSDNVTNWPKDIIEVCIFGSVKGAYTNAPEYRAGRLKNAENGTLFLDEIGDLKLEVQEKLLRVLQQRTYTPVGSDKEQKTNARFIFATNKDIIELKKKGEFREDLIFRLNRYHIHLPPLRDRKDDIPLLTDHFVYKYAVKNKIPMPVIPDSLYNLLLNYRFPGNIRELQGMVDVAMSLHEKGPLSIEEFVKKIREEGEEPNFSQPKPYPQTGQPIDHSILFGGEFPTYKKLTAVYTNEALRRVDGNKSKAARMAGLTRNSFIRYWEESNSPDIDNKKNKKDQYKSI
jgi:two-component system response regulator HydG